MTGYALSTSHHLTAPTFLRAESSKIHGDIKQPKHHRRSHVAAHLLHLPCLYLIYLWDENLYPAKTNKGENSPASMRRKLLIYYKFIFSQMSVVGSSAEPQLCFPVFLCFLFCISPFKRFLWSAFSPNACFPLLELASILNFFFCSLKSFPFFSHVCHLHIPEPPRINTEGASFRLPSCIPVPERAKTETHVPCQAAWCGCECFFKSRANYFHTMGRNRSLSCARGKSTTGASWGNISITCWRGQKSFGLLGREAKPRRRRR